MDTFKRTSRIAGWIVFGIAFLVYLYSVERTGSLWDCGEFLTGADKLEVVHPPGAPLFMIVGRMFALLGHMISDNPATVAFMVNLSSGIFTAFAAMFVALTTMEFGRLILVGRQNTLEGGDAIAVAGAGVVAGLITAFAPSIWFSAVEGEVYAMSTFFTTLTYWAAVKWYAMEDKPENDRWLIFSIVAAGMSTGVHLLSLMAFPAIALLYYFKKYPKGGILGAIVSMGIGVVLIGLIQKLIVTGIPNLWATFEIPLVNSMGLPRHSGALLAVLVISAILGGAMWLTRKRKMPAIHNFIFAFTIIAISYSVYGVIVIRANASPPINMNNPDDALSLLPYLNREQYGSRSLLKGPQYTADQKKIIVKDEPRYGWTGEKYEIVRKKQSLDYPSSEKVFFPRMYDANAPRPQLYQMWNAYSRGENFTQASLAKKPTAADNYNFFWDYQMSWMFGRYFMWNFVGKQNGSQGYYAWDKSAGNWISGIGVLDELHLGYDQSEITEKMKNDKSRNTYYFIPFLLGILGLVLHAIKRPKEFSSLMILFLITGVGLVIYANEPPNEPRERDYVFVGAFFSYAMWCGLGVIALYKAFSKGMTGVAPAGLAIALAASAPLLMGFQGFDDMGRKNITASRDYAHNFLESCDKNAIVFTYGDNDTYPLWYAQEIEHVRTDVRVINLSLIAVDWYINLVRRKVNDSPRIKMSIPQTAYRGDKRNGLFYKSVLDKKPDQLMPALLALKYAGEDHPIQLGPKAEVISLFPSRKIFIPVDRQKVLSSGVVGIKDTANIIPRMDLNLTGGNRIPIDQLAVLDIIASNLWERPIYFAVTCREEKVAWYKEYLQLEGLTQRIVPVRTAAGPNTPRQNGIIPWGRVDADIVLANVKKFWWGNFDKESLFVDHSYGAAIQSQRNIIIRAAQDFLAKGQKGKTVELLDLYLKGFPDMNFEFDYSTFAVFSLMTQAGAYDKVKPHLRTLEENVLEKMRFFSTVDNEILESSFRMEKQRALAAMDGMINMVKEQGDSAYEAELQAKFGSYLEQARKERQTQMTR